MTATDHEVDALDLPKKRFRSVHLREDLPFKKAIILSTSLPSKVALREDVRGRDTTEMHLEVG
jgi:hypothetical protein